MSEFIRQSSPQELSDFHRELLQGFQKLAAPPEPPKPQPKPSKPKPQAPPVKIVQKAKPKQDKSPNKQTRPKAAKPKKSKEPKAAKREVSQPVDPVRPVKRNAVAAIAQFLQDGKQATLDQLVTASQVSPRDAYPAIDWMQEERLIIRCGSCPTRYSRP